MTLSSRSLEVSWAPPPSEHHNGLIVGYKVLHLPATSRLGPADADVITTAGSERSVRIDNLEKWTEYKIWVLAFTRIGDGPRSDVVVAQTDEDGKMAPLLLLRSP